MRSTFIATIHRTIVFSVAIIGGWLFNVGCWMFQRLKAKAGLLPFYPVAFKPRECAVLPFPNFSSRIEFRRQHANQPLLPLPRGFLRCAFVPLNAPYQVQQPDDAARQALWIRDTIATKPFPQIPRLAHVQNSFRRAAKEIHAWRGRQRGEKLLAE